MKRRLSATLFRFTNVGLLAVLLLLTASGLYSFLWTSAGWVVHIHRIGAWALLALLPWKALISWRSLRRGVSKRPDRNIFIAVSLFLATLLIMAIILALLWTWQIGAQTWYGNLLLWWHWILALILLMPLTIHVWRRWPRPKRSDFTSRRAALRMLGMGAFGIVGWVLAESLAERRAESTRLITGSRQANSFSGNDFPITSEAAPSIDLSTYQLGVQGAVAQPMILSIIDLNRYPQVERTETLDCTNGWWTVQQWRGVPLAQLLDDAGMQADAIAVRLTSVTGYTQVFTLAEAAQILICTHVGGEALSHWHGAPVRAVVPTRRGAFWVKWLSEIVVLDSLLQVLSAPLTIR